MIAKTSIGNDFKGIFNYCLGKPKAKVLGTSHDLQFLDKKGYITSMAQTSSFWSGSKCVDHSSLSFTPEDDLNDDKMLEIAEDYFREKGYMDHQYVVVKHQDTKHPHVHLIINRVSPSTGKANTDSYSWFKNVKITNNLEESYALVKSSDRAKNKGDEFEISEAKKGVKDQKEFIKNRVESALSSGVSDIEELALILENHKIKLKILENKNGIYGVSFNTDKFSTSGNKIGWKYKEIVKVLEKNTVDKALPSQEKQVEESVKWSIINTIQDSLNHKNFKTYNFKEFQEILSIKNIELEQKGELLFFKKDNYEFSHQDLENRSSFESINQRIKHLKSEYKDSEDFVKEKILEVLSKKETLTFNDFRNSLKKDSIVFERNEKSDSKFSLIVDPFSGKRLDFTCLDLNFSMKQIEQKIEGNSQDVHVKNSIYNVLEKNIYDFDSFERRLSYQHNIKIKHDKKQNKIYFITPKNQKIEGESIGFGLKNLTYFIENKKEEKDNLLQENNSSTKNFTSFLLSMSSLDSKREEQAKNGLYKVMESVISQGITKFEEAKKEFEKHGIELYKDSEKQENRIKDINLRVDFSEDSIREPLEKFHLDLEQNQKNKDEKNQTAGREILKSIDFALESGAESFPELQRKLKEEDIEFKYSPKHVSTPDFLQFSKNNEPFSYGIILTSKWTGKELKERFDANVRKKEFTESIRECLKEKSLIGFKTALSKNEIRVKLDEDPLTNKPCISFEKGDMIVKSPELKQEAEVQNIINQIVEEKKLKQVYNQTKKEIATVIDETIQQSSFKDSTIESLSNELKKENINTSFTYYNKTVSGITFEKENIKLKGSELGDNYSINKLKERIEGQNKQVLEAHQNLRNGIDQAIKIVKEKDLPTLDEKLNVFKRHFKQEKVELTFHKNVKGIYGLSFRKDGLTIKASELNQGKEKNYSVKNIIAELSKPEKKTEQPTGVKEIVRPTGGDYKTNKAFVISVIDKAINQSSKINLDLDLLLKQLQKEGIKADFTYYNNTVSRIIFKKDEFKFNGSELGKDYSINKINDRIESQNTRILKSHDRLRILTDNVIKLVASKNPPSLNAKMDLFVSEFKKLELDVTFHSNASGVYGLSFEKNGITIKASELNQGKHKSYSAKNIIEALSKPEKKTEQPTGVKEIVRPTGGDYKTNKAFVISVIDKAINESSKINLDLDLLLKQLQEEGIKADFTYYNNTVSGIIFKKDEFKFNGSELGKDYNINKINDRIDNQNTRILKSHNGLRVFTDNVIKLVASENPPSLNAKMDLFVSEFKRVGVDAKFHSNASGIYGLSFEKDGITIKASELNQGKDKSYSAKNIIEALCSVSELLKDIKEPKEILNLDIPKRVKAKEYTKAVIDKALFNDRIYTLGDFIERLRKEDVRVIISGITSDGVFELSYQAHGEAFKGLEIESNKGNYSDAKVRKFLDNNSPVIKLQKSCDSLNLNVKAKGIVVQLNCLGIEVEGENLRFKELVAPIDKVFNKDISEKISGHPNDDLYLNHSSKEEKRMTINLFDLMDDDKVWLRGNKLVSDCFKMIERGVNVYLPDEYRKEGIVESICLLSENRESHHQAFPEPPRGSFLLQQFFKGLLSDIAVSNVPIKNKKKGDWDDEDENTRSYGGFGL